jgi:hypothetical protein
VAAKFRASFNALRISTVHVFQTNSYHCIDFMYLVCVCVCDVVCLEQQCTCDAPLLPVTSFSDVRHYRSVDLV